MEIKTKDAKQYLFLRVSNDPRGDRTIFIFTRTFESEARDMVSWLPSYLAFKYSQGVLIFFTADAASKAKVSPWDDVQKYIISATNNDLDCFDADDYGWNVAPAQVEIHINASLDNEEAAVPKHKTYDASFLNNLSVQSGMRLQK